MLNVPVMPQTTSPDGLTIDAGRGALKILFVVDELESMSAGGSERQVLQLVEILRSSGHNVSLAIFRKSDWLRYEGTPYPIHFCDVRSVLSPLGFFRLWEFVRWMRKEKFDVVQTMFREANLIGPPLARLAGIPVVLGSRRNLNHAMNRYFTVLQRFSNRFVSRLVANSEVVRDVVSKRERISPTKIDVLYNGVDTQYFGTKLTSTRIRFGISENATVVGVVSRFGWIKGLDIFVYAAKAVLTKHPETYFMMMGDGPTLPAVRALAVELKIAEKCFFVPAQRDIRPFLSTFDIAVLPSRSEGFSNALLEYMSAGLPIVSTNVGGNAEALGSAGVLVVPNAPDALAKGISILVEDPELRKKLGERAQTRAKELFDIKNAKIRLAEYFAKLAPKPLAR
jgi:L-malate glycosyltransferase